MTDMQATAGPYNDDVQCSGPADRFLEQLAERLGGKLCSLVAPIEGQSSDAEGGLMTPDSTGNDTSADASERILNRGKHLVREGTIRRVIVKRGDETIAHIPVIVVVAVAVVAPWLVAAGAIAALLSHCTITVQRADTEAEGPTPPEIKREPGNEEP
jgi:hypothetical protein